jgi:sarcosine oxidase subunit gamma
MAETMRKSPLSHTHGGSGTARLTMAPAASRISLRASSQAVGGLSATLGLMLPERPKASASVNDRHALWLGPDEWLLIGPDGTDFIGLARSSGMLHSATDISHRNVGIIVSGPGAATAIASACPHDLSEASFPIGACTRTVFGKMEIVLYRTGDDTYRVECWRSFAEYCFGMLAEGAADADL